MEITCQVLEDATSLCVAGRLDAYWADHLAAALEEAVRGGARRIELDLAQVSFLSSVGIRVLLRAHKQLARIDGTLLVVHPSVVVRQVLELAGLGELLANTATNVAAPISASTAPQSIVRGATGVVRIFALQPAASLRCSLIGDPAALASTSYAGAGSHRLQCIASAFGLGVGAFGRDYDECHNRFGEFLFAGGVAAYLPTDGSDVADYIVRTASLVPEVETLYALRCDGSFAHLLRFEANQPTVPTGIGELIDCALETSRADSIGLVLVAESAGLIGAALRRSPASGTPAALFDHPGIRDWLSFTPERAYARGVTLITGIASRAPAKALASFLRPMGSLQAHLHAASFTYHPLAGGRIDLETTVANLCTYEQLQGVLHLLDDDRPIVGAGASAFWRGALWVAPIGEVTQ